MATDTGSKIVERGQKFVRVHGNGEIRLTACAVTKDPEAESLIMAVPFDDDLFKEPNQFWKKDPNHEKALLKVYARELYKYLSFLEYSAVIQNVKIPMPFLGNDSADGWGELQFLIKAPRLVKLARHRSFDTRVNQWIPETQPIQPKNNMETHAYLALRFYHQDYLPPVPSDWRFEPVYVSVRNDFFYEIYIRWENSEITILIAQLSDKKSSRIPKHLILQ